MLSLSWRPWQDAFFGGAVTDPDTSFSLTRLLDELCLSFVAATNDLGSIAGPVHMGGVPIGVLSKIAASDVLGVEEHAWPCDVNRAFVTWFHGCVFMGSRGRGRYVDDILWVLFTVMVAWLLLFCVCIALPSLWSLDVRRLNGLTFSFRVFPWLGVWPPRFGLFLLLKEGFCDFFGVRFHRWHAIPLNTRRWLDAVVNVLVDLKLAGWPLSLISAVVFQAWRDPCRIRKALLICALARTWRQ